MRSRARQEWVRVAWREIVGELIAGVSAVHRIADGVLYVRCTTPVWAHTLSLRQKEILAKIAEHAGSGVIREVRFSSLPFEAHEHSGGRSRQTNTPSPETAASLTDAEKRKIGAFGASLKDEGIRKSLTRAATTAAQVRKRKARTRRRATPQ